MDKIKVLVVDDHSLVRDGIVAMINSFADMEVIGEASDGEEAINKALLMQPGIILMDIMLPGMNGMEAAEMIKGKHPHIKILFLSMEVSEEFLNQVIKMGAEGYVLKDIRKNELGMAVRKAYAGDQYFSQGISDLVFQNFYKSKTEKAKPKGKEASPSLLTEREIEVVKLLSQGLNKKEIAEQLFISPRTVDAHRSHVMEKLELKSTVELVKFAIRHNIIEL